MVCRHLFFLRCISFPERPYRPAVGHFFHTELRRPLNRQFEPHFQARKSRKRCRGLLTYKVLVGAVMPSGSRPTRVNMGEHREAIAATCSNSRLHHILSDIERTIDGKTRFLDLWLSCPQCFVAPRQLIQQRPNPAHASLSQLVRLLLAALHIPNI